MMSIKCFCKVAPVLGIYAAHPSFAADDTVVAVIPLFKQPIGDATEADVGTGKTFSNGTGVGLT